MAKKKVLVSGWHPGSVSTVAPVAKWLQLEERVEPIVVVHPILDGDPKLYENVFNNVTLPDGSKRGIAALLAQANSELRKYENVFTSKGVPYHLLSEYGLNDVSPGSIRKLLEQIKPDVVLTGTSVQSNDQRHIIEHSLALESRAMGIPSIAVLDFWANYWQRFSQLYTPDGKFAGNLSPDLVEGGYLKFLPSKVAVMDEIAISRMTSEGFPEDRLAITGNPNFDNLGELAREHDIDTADGMAKLRKIGDDLGVPASAYLVSYFSDITKDLKQGGFGFTDVDCIDVLCAGMAEADPDRDIVLLIKKHPREDQERFDDAVAKARSYGYPVIVPTYDTKKVALASDLVVAPVSTVLIEATLMGRQALSLQPSLAREDALITNQLGITPYAHSREEGIELAAKIVSGDKPLLDHYKAQRERFKVDGRATEKVADLVYQAAGVKQ